MPNIFEKDPDAKKDYEFDWSRWLEGDTIVSSSTTCATPGIIESEGHTTTKAVVWLQGGTTWSQYKITNRITTAAGRVDEWTITLVIKPK